MYNPQHSFSRLFTFGVIPMITCFVIAIACTREQAAPKTKSEHPYGMSAIQPDIALFKSAAAKQPLYSKLQHELDFTQVQALRSSLENVLVYIVKLKDKDQYYGVKIAGSTASTEILFSRKMTDTQNGSIGMMKNNEAILINYVNGIRTVRAMTEPEYKLYFTKEYHGGTGFCQREPGESFGECFQAETAEFCDSFISCVALATNPQVSILIGLTCSCGATMSVS